MSQNAISRFTHCLRRHCKSKMIFSYFRGDAELHGFRELESGRIEDKNCRIGVNPLVPCSLVLVALTVTYIEIIRLKKRTEKSYYPLNHKKEPSLGFLLDFSFTQKKGHISLSTEVRSVDPTRLTWPKKILSQHGKGGVPSH